MEGSTVNAQEAHNKSLENRKTLVNNLIQEVLSEIKQATAKGTFKIIKGLHFPNHVYDEIYQEINGYFTSQGYVVKLEKIKSDEMYWMSVMKSVPNNVTIFLEW